MSTTETANLTITDIANRLFELCHAGQYEQAQDELYSPDALSIEPPQSQGLQSAKGLDEIKKKGHAFQQMLEAVHRSEVTGPLVAGNHIAIGLILDATLKGMGRQVMEELCMYEVKDGKIVKEQFFYSY
jgi:hypothetical protein